MRDKLRRFDRHRRHLLISELVDGSGRVFQVAFQLALMEAGHADRRCRRAQRARPPTRCAGCCASRSRTISPPPSSCPMRASTRPPRRSPTTSACSASASAPSFEQVCHRLTTLQRPTARGVPFFMLRVDHAGNVSKRFSSGTFPFSKFGGTCPLWNVHATFDTPGRVVTQVIELPDGSRYFSIAQTVRAADRAVRAAAAALRDRPRLRDQIRLAAGLLDGAQPHRHHADRRQLPPVRARQLQPARRAAADARTAVRRDDARRLAVPVQRGAGVIGRSALHLPVIARSVAARSAAATKQSRASAVKSWIASSLRSSQ